MKRSALPNRARWRLCLAVLPAMAVSVARGSASTWTGGGADSNWNTALNWNPVAAPSNNGTADLTFDGSTNTSPVVNTPWNVDSLSFAATASAFTIIGSALTIGPGGVSNLGSSSETIGAPVILGGDQIWNAGPSNAILFVQGPINTNGHALTLESTGAVLLNTNSNVSGGGSVIAAGPGQSILYGTNSYTGGTFVNDGQLYTNGGTSLGAANSPININNGAELRIGSATTIPQPITLGAGGGLISTPGEAIVLGGNITGPGMLTVDGGSFQLNGTNSYAGGNTVTDSATLIGNSSSIQGDVSFAFQYAGYPSLTFQQNTNGVYAGNISGRGIFTKSGTGTLTLTGNNTYTSDTLISGGVLEIVAGTNGINNSDQCDFSYGGVLQFVGSQTYTNNNVGWDVGGGGFAARGGYSVVNLGGSGALITMNPSLSPMIFGTATSDSVIEFQNALSWGAGPSTPAPVVQVNSGVGGDYALLSGQISGSNSLVKTGTGMLQLSATNTFTGGLYIAAGVVQANNGVGLPANCPLQLTGGVLMGNGTFSRSLGTTGGMVKWNSSGGFAAAGGTLTVNIGGAGATQTWGATNFVPTASTLIFGAPRANAQTLFVNPINLGTTIRTIQVNAGLGGDFANLSGALTGSGGLSKTGSGELMLSGTSTYTASTNVTSGSLVVTGTLTKTTVIVFAGASLGGTGTIAGTVNMLPTGTQCGTLNFVDGAPGTLTLSDPTTTDTVLTIGGTAGTASILDFEVGATADRILISAGKVKLNAGGGVINITPLSGIHGGVFDLLDFPAGQATGLANFSLSSTSIPGYSLALVPTSTSEQLDITAVPEPCAGLSMALPLLLMLQRRKGRHR